MCLALFLASLSARADTVVPPWVEPGDLPLPTWAQSVAPLRSGVPIASSPGHPDAQRGEAVAGARLPLFGAKRAAGCAGRWLLVGPMAWVCSDAAEPSRDAPGAPPERKTTESLPYRYYAVGPDGAEAFTSPPADDGAEAPEETLDAGFSVAVVEEREVGGVAWARTTRHGWIAIRELQAFRPSTYQGETVTDGSLDFGWVTSDVAAVYGAPSPRGKPVGKRARFERVGWREERPAAGGGGVMVRVSDDGASPAQWMRVRDLTRPTPATPPDVAGGAFATGRWIDVDVGAQVLVAYEASKPVYATLVSAGRAPGETPAGVFRVGVKLVTANMDHLAPEEDAPAPTGERHEHAGDHAEPDRFAIEDVPYVQYFDRGIALHAAFWHRDFGRPHTHGSIDLSPKDAAWLFAFTSPHLPAGWDVVDPTPLERGTVVSVRAM